MTRTLAILAFVAACHPQPSPVRPEPIPPPVPVKDASPEPGPPPAPLPGCERTCAILEAAGCPEGKSTQRGVRCSELCNAVEATGYAHAFDRCTYEAATIEQVRACGLCK